jgi:D-serine dehydratase
MEQKPHIDIQAIERSIVDDTMKGVPANVHNLRLKDVGAQRWNVLREDLPLPVAVLKHSALQHNLDWMRRFATATGTVLCPHGKTTMSPQLFELQLRHGAWGITAATISQLHVYRRYGVPRILFANQLIGRRNIEFVLDELRSDPHFDFYCLVDSHETVTALKNAAMQAAIGRPLQVLLEVGQSGGRAGTRTFEHAIEIAKAVASAQPYLALRGIEGYEGILPGANAPDMERRVSQLMRDMSEIAVGCNREGLFSSEPIILSAGGSAYFDFPAEQLRQVDLGRSTLVVLRSGCYLTHDSSWLAGLEAELRERSPRIKELGPGLQPALEIWAYVQSRPEQNLALVTMGKRDCSYDIELPTPVAWARASASARPQELGSGYKVLRLNDQHAYLHIPAESQLRVGDLVGFGVAHPCTTFDKWQLLFVVNEDYDVLQAVRTFF